MSNLQLFLGPEAIRRELERQVEEEDEDDDRADAVSVTSEVSDGVLQNDDDVHDEFQVDANDYEGDEFNIYQDSSSSRDFVLGKDLETVWTDKPLLEHSHYRTPSRNIITHLPGARGRARNANSELEFFSLHIDDSMVAMIVLYTNEEIDRMVVKYVTPQRYTNTTNEKEVKALLGMLIMSGVLKNSNLSLDDLFSNTYGIPFFRATMSKTRFTFLLCALRFDSKNTRAEKCKADVFAPFRELWEKFIANCDANYTPSEYVTIDETLLSFRGRCPFKMYIPNKPDKYGLKIVSMCDARTFYFCKGIPYIGKSTLTDNIPLGKPTQYVMKLASQIERTNRNITMDNWFTSYELAEQLTEKKLTLVGTVRKNKKELPPSFVDVKGIPLKTSRFLYQPDKMMVSYNQKPNKNVIIMSTMHDTGVINPESGKSDIVEFYNLTKGGVDVFDQLCHTYTTKRASRRWPMRFFYGLLDAAALNSYVLFCLKPNDTKRSSFLKSLALSLVEPHMRQRLSIPNLPKSLRRNICSILGVEEDEGEGATVAAGAVGRGRCVECGRSKDRKTKYACDKCSRHLCLDHAKFMCRKCLNDIAHADSTDDENRREN